MCVFREKLTVDKFEEIGRRLDEEVTRLFQYIEEEVAPETERSTASFLPTVLAKLAEAAAKVEARRKQKPGLHGCDAITTGSVRCLILRRPGCPRLRV